jgi:hypothetical protein
VIAPVLVLVPLIAALIGGVLGDRFHRAVDRAGVQPLEPELVPKLKAELEKATDEFEAQQQSQTEAATEVDEGPPTEAEPTVEHRETETQAGA